MSWTYTEAALQICREIIESEPELFRLMTPEEREPHAAAMAAEYAEIVALMTAENEPSL